MTHWVLLTLMVLATAGAVFTARMGVKAIRAAGADARAASPKGEPRPVATPRSSAGPSGVIEFVGFGVAASSRKSRVPVAASTGRHPSPWRSLDSMERFT